MAKPVLSGKSNRHGDVVVVSPSLILPGLLRLPFAAAPAVCRCARRRLAKNADALRPAVAGRVACGLARSAPGLGLWRCAAGGAAPGWLRWLALGRQGQRRRESRAVPWLARVLLGALKVWASWARADATRRKTGKAG